MKYVSGIRPTGNIHLGNYLGAIKQWKELGEGTWFVADLHGGGDELMTQDILAKLGIKSVIESDYDILPLYHKLSFHVPVGWLNRMTQYKDKSKTEDSTLALLAYPVLMAADIFYFGGTHIPIGDDQKQHIEFVRDIAIRTGYTPPEPVIGKYPRIMSLKDGARKMSKSDGDDMSRINVMDSASVIREKIMKAKSACDVSDDTPEMRNLRTIWVACGGGEIGDMRVKDFKEQLAELVVGELCA